MGPTTNHAGTFTGETAVRMELVEPPAWWCNNCKAVYDRKHNETGAKTCPRCASRDNLQISCLKVEQ